MRNATAIATSAGLVLVVAGGAFDPTVLDAVEAHGYRRPHEELALEPMRVG